MIEVEGELAIAGKIILDVNGNGTIDYDVSGAWERWVITRVRVKTSQLATDAPYPTCEVFCGPVSDAYSQGATWTGNSDTFDGEVRMDSGLELHVVFTGGIPGTIASAILSGRKYTQVA